MKAACIQLRSGSDLAANSSATQALIRAAHKDGAEFVATPENTGLIEGSSKGLFAALRSEQDTQIITDLRALAKELAIHMLIGGTAVKADGSSKAANRQFLISPTGDIVARYDKINMFDVEINETETWRESNNYQAGAAPVTAPVGDFTLGMSICYDLRFAALYKHYAKHGANIISVPAAFTAVTGKAHWEVLLRARAIETSSYVIAPAQGGIHDRGRHTWGHSMIVDPWGRIIACIDNDEPGYCIADLSMGAINKTRSQIPAWQQRMVLP